MLNINESLEFIHKFSTSKRKESEEFLQALREWSLTEEFYSKGMERLSTHSGLNFSSDFFSTLKSYTLNISQQAKDLSQKLNDYIIIHFKELLTTQSHSVKNTYSEGKRLVEYMLRKHSIAVDSMTKYFTSCRDCEHSAFELDKEASQSKKEKILQKMLSIKKDLDSSFFTYSEATNSYNDSLLKFRKSIEKVVDAYNFYEEKRCKCFEECLEMLKSILSDSSKTFSGNSPQIVPYMHNASIFAMQELAIENYEGVHPLFTGVGNTSPYLHYSLLESSGVAEGTSKVIEEIYRKDIGDIVTKAWAGQDLSREDYITFNMRIKEPQGRKAWSWSMNLRRNQGDFLLNDSGYLKIGELMLSALNECERTQDVYIAKNCIILSQTFFKITQKQKVYLQNCIMLHSIWSNMAFWESVVNTAIFEELKKQPSRPVQYDEDAMNHEKNLVFCQLVSFGHIMMSFKLPLSATEQLVNKYAVKYLFSKQDIKDIILAVNDSLETQI